MHRTKGIYLAVLNQGCVRPELAQLVAHLTHEGKYDIYVSFPTDKPIQHNRNNIVQNFLKTDYEYLMMLDGDIIPPANILDLVDLDKDIIGGLCFAYRGDSIMPLILKEKPDEPEMYNVLQAGEYDGLIEADAIGTGCIIIKREVLENLKHPFWNKYDENGLRTAGLDLTFCKRAKEMGYKVWCHLNYRCSHWTSTDLLQNYDAIMKRDDTMGVDKMDYKFMDGGQINGVQEHNDTARTCK